jgi:hypothetical protein
MHTLLPLHYCDRLLKNSEGWGVAMMLTTFQRNKAISSPSGFVIGRYSAIKLGTKILLGSRITRQ